MKIDIRQVSHPDAVKTFDTDALRRHFLVETLFVPGEAVITYTHVDRLAIGGVLPVGTPVDLPNPPSFGTKTFLARRELGVFNVGGPGRITVDGTAYELAARDCLYVGKGAETVTFESLDAASPAKYYLLSAPSHAVHETRKIAASEARAMAAGSDATSNKRTIHQYIVPDICPSSQLVMGMTQLQPGSVWNTMPCHVHDRRSEVYFYFDIDPAARVFHFMGEPNETRHIVMAGDQAVISPGWSVHSGCGTSNYAFIWGMGGDNQDYTDMDMVAMDTLR